MNYHTLTLPQIYDETEAIAVDAQTLFGDLDVQQLNWKPSAAAWSVAQCLDHLISINRAYYPILDRIMKGEYPRALLHRLPLLSALFGRMMIRELSPDYRKKYKAPPTARPSASTIDASIVQRFLTQQRETLAKMRSLEDKRPETIVITSPFASVVVYSLLDALRLVVAHERRHFAQARRVMEASGFPRRPE
ncbi:MAG: DinB family protein [Longimicrobiales bacterium]